MEIIVSIIHVVICLLLIVAVLMQAGKGGGLAGALGGGLSSSSVLGGRTATTFLTKTTAVLAGVFMVLCLLQSITYEAPAANDGTTATERMLEQSGEPPLPPAFSEGFLEEEPAAEESPVVESAPAVEEAEPAGK